MIWTGFSRWATRNILCLNPNNSKCIIIVRRSLGPSMSFDILRNGSRISIVDAAKILGIVINNILTWVNHIIE